MDRRNRLFWFVHPEVSRCSGTYTCRVLGRRYRRARPGDARRRSERPARTACSRPTLVGSTSERGPEPGAQDPFGTRSGRIERVRRARGPRNNVHSGKRPRQDSNLRLRVRSDRFAGLLDFTRASLHPLNSCELPTLPLSARRVSGPALSGPGSRSSRFEQARRVHPRLLRVSRRCRRVIPGAGAACR